MTQSIPASQLVNVIPGVLGAGGNPLSLNSVFLTQDTSIPVGTVKAFATLADVQAWFGANSAEATLAAVYFAGFSNATVLPSVLYFAQYNVGAVAGYLRGGSLAGVPLATIQGLAGTITVVIDGVSHVSNAIDLSTATSFSNAAALIQTALQAGTPTTTATVTYDALRKAFVITSATTGASSTLAFPTTNSLTTGLKLTAATGAIVAPGAVAGSPASILGGVVTQTQNWAMFMTVWEPDLTTKEAFAAWVQTINQRYTYVAWDSDVTPKAGDAPASFGAVVKAANDNGVFVIWDTTGAKAAFVCGTTASIDFTAAEGRITYAFKGQPGLTADVYDATTANNLLANGYNFYGAYATANDQFVNLQNGQIAGQWKWLDPYVNQIWLNNALQLAFMSFLTQAKSVPYNAQGYSLLRAVALDPINAALNFGAIRPGVALSATQAAEVNSAAGVPIADTLEQIGWYLQILPASALTRAARGSPPMTLWYTDGGSIQKINLASIDIE
jgi:hypothetical protein